MAEDAYLAVTTPLGRQVRTTAAYWDVIATLKHPIMRGKEVLVQQALQTPIEIRQSKSDPSVYLHYGVEPPYLICVVVRYLNGDGFIITAYRTNKIKEGAVVWTP
ncbi:DUF4258 domain-containing protein [Nodosilinea sp. PGN35]|nr:DUF4258 domain-containing protein [Nodosilinea sp. TSF1-S3]